MSSSHRGGTRSTARAPRADEEQLYNEARQRNIPGRSTMSKEELRRAVYSRK